MSVREEEREEEREEVKEVREEVKVDTCKCVRVRVRVWEE